MKTFYIVLKQSDYPAMRARLVAAGVPVLVNDTAEFTRKGVKLRLSYDRSRELATIEVLSKPFYVPMNRIEGAIKKWLDA